jgi:predicted HTH domain antitoxin
MDSANRAFEIMSDWMNRSTKEWTNTIKLSTDFGPEEFEQGDVQLLLDARLAGDISREQFMHELMRRGVLADDFDIKKKITDDTGSKDEGEMKPRTNAERKNN